MGVQLCTLQIIDSAGRNNLLAATSESPVPYAPKSDAIVDTGIRFSFIISHRDIPPAYATAATGAGKARRPV